MDLSVLILTFNEQLHIERCIKSLQPLVNDIFIVDSFSTDQTVEIAESLGAKVFRNKWVNYANQFQWGLDHCPIKTRWVMRMDADEYILPELATEILQKIGGLNDDVSGIYIKRRVYFMDKWIKHGSYYPIWLLRIWRYEKGKIESRWMDEHIKLISEGKTIQFDNDLVDDNQNNLTWWTEKHNNYATREAVDILNILLNFIYYDEVEAKLLGTQEQRKRWFKIRYASLPLFVRPFLYFIWRYFIKLGFMDGKQGLVWHFLQGFWYRFLVDAKIYQMKKIAQDKNKTLKQVIKQNFGIDLDGSS